MLDPVTQAAIAACLAARHGIERAVFVEHPKAKELYDLAVTDDQRIQVIRSFVPNEAQRDYEVAVETYKALLGHCGGSLTG